MAEQTNDTTLPADRLLLFSDAVVAIAITLLALELPIPEGANGSELWQHTRANFDHYLAFAISFAVIGVSWMRHHRVLSSIKNIDHRLVRFNLSWLFMIVITPAVTQLLAFGSHDDKVAHACRFGAYSLVQVLLGTTFMLLSLKARRLNPLDTSSGITAPIRDYADTVIAFALSIPTFFIWRDAWVVWIVVPMIFGRTRSILRWRHQSVS